MVVILEYGIGHILKLVWYPAPNFMTFYICDPLHVQFCLYYTTVAPGTIPLFNIVEIAYR